MSPVPVEQGLPQGYKGLIILKAKLLMRGVSTRCGKNSRRLKNIAPRILNEFELIKFWLMAGGLNIFVIFFVFS